VLVFGHATDAVMEMVGLGPAYREAHDASLYTVEAHVRYLDEVSAGSDLEVRSSIIGGDAQAALDLARALGVGPAPGHRGGARRPRPQSFVGASSR
jgi:acyl-CoA thioester hydrolase